MQIRPIEAADRAAVADLWIRCGLVVSYNDPGADIDFCMAGGHATILVGVDGEAVIASAMVGDDGHRGWIYYVAVDPGRQGEGLGREIVAAAEDFLKVRGVPKVQLMVRETNRKVVGFYEGIGYEETPRVVMAKWLR